MVQKLTQSLNFFKKILTKWVFPENCSYRANPNAVNNDVPVPGKSLTDYRSNIEEILEDAEEQDLEAFLDKEQTIQMGLNHISEEADLLEIAEEPCGYSVPEDPYLRPQDIIKEENYPKEHCYTNSLWFTWKLSKWTRIKNDSNG